MHFFLDIGNQNEWGYDQREHLLEVFDESALSKKIP
jgi:hypothetical protein